MPAQKPATGAKKAPAPVAPAQPVFDCRKTYFVSPPFEQMVNAQTLSSEQAKELSDAQKKAMDNHTVYLTPTQASFSKGLAPFYKLHGYHDGMRFAGAKLANAAGSSFGNEGANLKSIIKRVEQSEAVVGKLKENAETIDMSLIQGLSEKMVAIRAKNPDMFTTAEFEQIANVLQLAVDIKNVDTSGAPSTTQLKDAERTVSKVWQIIKNFEKMGSHDVPILCSPLELLAFHGTSASEDAVKGREELLQAFAKVGITEEQVLAVVGIPNLPGKKAAAPADAAPAPKRAKKSPTDADASGAGAKPPAAPAAPAASSAGKNPAELLAALNAMIGKGPQGDGGAGA
jgi:hypothetical protein